MRKKVAVIGCGVIGSAFARHFSERHTLILCDQGNLKSMHLAKELSAEVYSRQSDAVERADVVILAVKPKDLFSVSKLTAEFFSQDKLLLSVLAGTSLALLRKHFPLGQIVRLMPNLALTCGEGVIGVVSEDSANDSLKETVQDLLQGLGLISWLPEDKIEALSALTGSGPAFIFLLIEAMVESGIALGFTSSEAMQFVLKTVEGAVKLIETTQKHPAELKWQVASPGGMTIEGLKELEVGAIQGTVIRAFEAAYKKGKELQKK